VALGGDDRRELLDRVARFGDEVVIDWAPGGAP